MNKFIIIYLCSLAVATGSFAQTPTASPLATTPATTATISPTASKIEQSIRKKHKKHFGLTIGDHDKDLDALDRLGDEKSGDLPEFVIPIVAITMLTVFGAPVLIVGLIMYFSFSRSRALQKTVRMMVEKGQPVPEALLNPPPAQRQRSDLRRGVILTMIGLGLMVFLGAVNDWEGGSWTIGLIPFLIGAGYLLVWKLDTKKDIPPPLP